MSDETKTGGEGGKPELGEEAATLSPWARYCDLEVDGRLVSFDAEMDQRLVESLGDAVKDEAKLAAWCAEVGADFGRKLLAYLKER